MAAFITNKKCYLHNKNGSTIAELPPSLLILLIVIFFPMLNLMYLFLAYCAGWYLNQIEARQVSFMKPGAALGLSSVMSGGVMSPSYVNSAPFSPNSNPQTALPQSATWNGFMGVTEQLPDSPSVTYIPLVDANGKTENQVGQAKVTTSVSIRPFLTQSPPWLPQVPGLTEAWNSSYTIVVFQEEQTPP